MQQCSDRFRLTSERLCGNNLRVISYNVLANHYARRPTAKLEHFPYCPAEYLDFNHRRVLLVHEIKSYNADVIFLQECDREFFENDLMHNLGALGYEGNFKCKHNKTEGEAVFFRKERFKFVKSYDCLIADELKSNEVYKTVLERMEATDDALKKMILSRNTLLQLVLVESIESPGNYILLANTHLYFDPNVVFLRLIQMIVSIKKIEETIKSENLASVGVLYAGDFNSEPASLAIQYVFFKDNVFKALPKDQKQWIEGCEPLFKHSLSLQTFSNYQYTTFTHNFHSLIDYIFYDQYKFILKNVVPMLTLEELSEHVALPSKVIPSDHLAIIYELEWKLDSLNN